MMDYGLKLPACAQHTAHSTHLGWDPQHPVDLDGIRQVLLQLGDDVLRLVLHVQKRSYTMVTDSVLELYELQVFVWMMEEERA